MAARTPRQIIDQAVKENRYSAYLVYGMASVFALVGVGVLVWAVLNRAPVLGLAGSLPTALFWPAVNCARQTRKENVAIRLLEAPLSHAESAKEAADILGRVYADLMLEKPSPTVKEQSAAGSK